MFNEITLKVNKKTTFISFNLRYPYLFYYFLIENLKSRRQTLSLQLVQRKKVQ